MADEQLQTILDSGDVTGITLDVSYAPSVAKDVAVKENVDAKEDSIGAKGTAFNKAYGSTVDTVTQGNDSRLSDARTPTAHTHIKVNITDFNDADYATAAQGATADTALQSFTESDPVFLAQKGAANGVVGNDNSEAGANSVLNAVFLSDAAYTALAGSEVATTLYVTTG